MKNVGNHNVSKTNRLHEEHNQNYDCDHIYDSFEGGGHRNESSQQIHDQTNNGNKNNERNQTHFLTF